MSYINKKLRESAQGEECTLHIVGVCNYDPQTTVLAHLPDESNGMGKKVDDWSSCYACDACHNAIDRRGSRAEWLEESEREFYMRRAMVRTWRRWVELKLVRFA